MAMRFRAHDTFFIRKGWLNKGMKNVRIKPHVFTDKEENPMDIFGIGSNMVKALRYWLQAVGLTFEPKRGKRVQKFTYMGELIFNNDKYFEELGTLLLLHYKLATNKEDATSWYYFYNIFNQKEFTKDDFVSEINKYISMEDASSVALRSLNDDFTCLMNTYISRTKTSQKKACPESNIDCPFGELGFIDIVSRGKSFVYRKSIPSPSMIDPWIAFAVIVDQARNGSSVHLSDLLNRPCNIGKIFNLDSISLLEILHRIEKMGEIRIIRTAGLDIINIINKRDFMECLEKYYENIKN